MAEDVNSPELLEQHPFNVFNTLSDAIAGVTFKTKGLIVYIIGEDKFYYWRNDIDGFQLLGSAI